MHAIYVYKHTGDKPEMKDAFRELLPVATHWRNIGILLGIKDHILEAINHDNQAADDGLREMLTKWLNSAGPPPSWSKLADAVEPFDEAKAQEIRDAHDSHPKAYHISTSIKQN